MPGAVTFGAATNVPTPNSATGTNTELADLNGDGKLDLLATTKSGGNYLVAALGNGDGTFQAGTQFGLADCTYAISLAVGDLNADNRSDVVVACSTTPRQGPHGKENMGSIVALLGDGAGGFGAATPYYQPIQVGDTNTTKLFPWDVRLADVDQDGDLDAITANTNGGNVSVFRNDGNGNLGAGTNYAVAPGSPPPNPGSNARPQGLAVGDFNEDGKADVVTANDSAISVSQTSQSISLLLAGANGTLQQAEQFSDPTSLPQDAEAGDLNGDGHLDVVVAHTGRSLTVFFGDGHGDFAAPLTFDVGGAAGRGVSIADVNADGRPDILTDNGPEDQPTVLLGDGTGGFTQATPGYGSTSGSASDYAVGDVNGDGKLDLVPGSTSAGVLARVLLNKSKGDGSSQATSLKVVATPGVLSLTATLPAVNFGKVTGPWQTASAGLGLMSYFNTLPGNSPWSVTVAATDLVSGANSIHWNTLRLNPSASIYGTGNYTGYPSAGPSSLYFPDGPNPVPGTSLSPALTLLTASGATRGQWRQTGNTASWLIPDGIAPGAYTGVLQYTITG